MTQSEMEVLIRDMVVLFRELLGTKVFYPSGTWQKVNALIERAKEI